MINCYFQFPVSFVINFVLPKDQALKQVEEENLSTKALITNADKQKGQSDEADKSRTQVNNPKDAKLLVLVFNFSWFLAHLSRRLTVSL